ncbi:MAG: TetR/AcrR family transcriptional regulator [Thermoanaerobaculia bacterium]
MTTAAATGPETSSTASRRRRDPDATRAAILEAAEELFLARGPDDTPMSEIGRRAGVTKSLIHHHFGSKQELWDEIKRLHFGRYYDLQKEMLASSPGTAQLLHDSIVTYFRFLQSDPRAVRYLSWRLVEADDLCLDQEDELFELGVAKIRDAQEAGELRSDVEPISIIKAFLALTENWFLTKPLLCQLAMAEADPDELEKRYLEDVLKIFFEGARPPLFNDPQ